MRLAKVITTTATPTSLADLLENSDEGANGIALQALTGAPFMGTQSQQPFAVPTTLTLLDEIKNTGGLYFSGVGTVAVGVF